jgi:hypothetical protein
LQAVNLSGQSAHNASRQGDLRLFQKQKSGGVI